jgi:hypothetical protein
MFKIQVDGNVVGVCAAPYESTPETIQVGYILVDGKHLEMKGFGFAAGVAAQVSFDLVDDTGKLVYERCLIHNASRVYYMKHGRGTLLEDSRIQFLYHHQG